MNEFIGLNYLYVVVGATTDQEKWGCRVLHHLRAHDGFKVVGVNPKYSEVDGVPCYPDLASVPGKIDVVITVVPPEVTEKVVQQCLNLGIGKIWMQPGSETQNSKVQNSNVKIMVGKCIVVDGLGHGWGEV